LLDELAALRAEINTQDAKITKLESDMQMANSRIDELEAWRDNLYHKRAASGVIC